MTAAKEMTRIELIGTVLLIILLDALCRGLQ